MNASQQDLVAVRLTLFALFLTFLITASFLVSILSHPHSFPITQQHDDDYPHQEGDIAEMAKKAFSNSWAYYAPYYPAASFQESTRTPEGCVISQVNIVSRHATPQSISTNPVIQLQRHGARYPTSGVTKAITVALAKLQAATSYNDSRLDFINSYTYDLGEGDLVQYGADQ